MTNQKSTKNTYNRKDIIKNLTAASDSKLSERAFAKSQGIPKSTMQGWRRIRSNIKDPLGLADFMESEIGVGFLNRLVYTIIFHLHECGGASLHLISECLKDMGLAGFLATSPTYLKEYARTLQDQIIAFGEEQEELLNANMESRKVSIAEDETFFHDQTFLVAMEPVSNYILLEKKVEDRKAETWNEQMSKVSLKFNVEIIQSCSDQGGSLIKHVKEHLNAESSADLFHISQDIGRSGSAALSLKEKKCKELLESEMSKRENLKKEKSAVSEFDKQTRRNKLNRCRKLELKALKNLREAQKKVKIFKKGRRAVSRHYHPFDLETGLRQSPQKVEALISADMQNCAQAIRGLSEPFQKKLAKAKKLIPKMSASVQFFFATMASFLKDCKFDQRTRNFIEEDLVPAAYLLLVSQRTRDRKTSQDIREVAEEKRIEFISFCKKTFRYSVQEREEMWAVAMEIAQVFQRSSSCVEGRNGQLSLKYHTLHRLTDRKLGSLTVLHNFHISRSDGTTAAQRFFRQIPAPLFETVLTKMPELSRPRKHTKKTA